MSQKIKKLFRASLLTTLLRATKVSVTNMYRNKLFTFSTIGVISLIMFMLNITLGLNMFASNILKAVQEKVDIILYLKDDADLLKVKELEDTLKNMHEVKTVKYTSKDEALKKFMQNYSNNNNLFEKYITNNPLPSDLTIVTEKAEDHQKVLNFVKQSELSNLLASITETDVVNSQITNNVVRITRNTESFLFWLIITFTISTVLIIINSIHLTIYTRKNEIEVMKLVGARSFAIKAPFIIEGVLYGLITTIISAGLIFIVSHQLNILSVSESVDTLSNNPLNLIQNMMKDPRYIGAEILIGMTLGLISSWIATTLYFRKHQ